MYDCVMRIEKIIVLSVSYMYKAKNLCIRVKEDSYKARTGNGPTFDGAPELDAESLTDFVDWQIVKR